MTHVEGALPIFIKGVEIHASLSLNPQMFLS